ncbi:MAG TPA: molybdopterin-binding protein [Blastocatellia bacterium]|nr:molybdopterin-binding protein [Blastocatellia bacterium]
MVNVEIVAIGNEVLLGLVQDTNSNYLCRVVRGMGGRVRHIAIVRDEVDSIVEDLRASLDRGAEMIFTCGGLGPTADDLTLAAVAEAARVQLETNAAARDFVERRYRELAREGRVASSEMNDARLKMARLPAGASMRENPVGAAPAVMMQVGSSRIVSLPGVPAELKAIVEGPLQKLLGEVFGRGSYREREFTVECNDESLLAPALRKVAADHPEVYIKSRASHFGPDVRFRILISASATSAQEADAMIRRASDDLTLALREAGIKD